MNGKSDITIQGAANNTSILAASSGPALKIYASSGITINNVAFRAGGGNTGLVVAGSSVTVANVTTAGNSGTGVVVASYNGVNGVLNASSSHFDSSHSGDGLDVQAGTVTVNGCTFNNNGTSQSSAMGSGISLEGNSQATIVNSQLIGNWNADLVAQGQTQVSAQGSTFSGSHQGDGMLLANQGAVNLTGNTFASNGTVVGFATNQGRDGIEIFHTFSGTAVISGNTFLNNTGDGIYVGSAPSAMQITSNTFDSNLIGLDLDANVAPVNVVVTGNSFSVPQPGYRDQGLVPQGISAAGSGVTATVGGTGAAANAFANFDNQRFIVELNQNGQGGNIGSPGLSNVAGNSFVSGGSAVSLTQAIGTCC
jgi:parallel beta-helix repeat protein